MSKQIVRMPQRSAIVDSRQEKLDLHVDRHLVQDGIGMGVLRDGTTFLNQRGLAELCGVRNKYIGIFTAEWNLETRSEDTRRIREIISEQGEMPEVVAHEVHYGKKRILAYPDFVCMAVLEYFAFEKGWAGESIAQTSYRTLARHGLRQFIYHRVGYTAPESSDVWRIFRDRVSLTYDAVPCGYFGVFKELSSLIVTLGLAGLHIDENFVPDISVGLAWANHWQQSGLEGKYGVRRTYPHNYPEYFPQSASNPQMAACYPEEALGEFRRWFRQDYIGEGRFKKYLAKKVSDRLLPDGYVERAILALSKE